MTVNGSSSITVTPTIAYVTLGVATFNKDVLIAQSSNAEKMDAVYKALSALGIAKEKIKTVSYNISARYDYKDNVSVLAGYDVLNSVQVTVTDLKKVSKVLDMTVKQGINQSNSISFSITDSEREALYLKALASAVTSAKAKASALAAAAGVTIGKPSQIIESSSSVVYPPMYGMGDYAKAESVATPISGGELKIEASVNVVYNY
ncbi:MAG: DUF541 domain-containing protein [Clostridia bacterium]|nr:DUF541 domain-containing protein [Clostridia bacterium]